MKISQLAVICSFILSALPLPVTASASDLAFLPMPLEGSLPSNEIRKLYQDKEGYLWISTYGGLARYDGYDVLVYKVDHESKRQNLSNFVNMVVEDDSHRLWIGTHDGLYVLDKVSGKVSKVDYPVLNHCRIESIVSARDGNLWVATNRGLFCKVFNSDDFQYCVGNKWNLDPTDMKTLLEDDLGYLWIGTWSSHLIRYDVHKRKAYRYSFIPELQSSHTLFRSQEGDIWVGTWGEGLVRLINPYDMDHVSYVTYRNRSNKSSLLDNIIYVVSQDPNTGYIWIGSRSGLSILKDKNDPESFVNYVPDGKRGSLPFNEVNSILCTHDGIMWLGMLGGGVYHVNAQKPFIQTNSLIQLKKKYGTSSLNCMYIDENGKYWLGLPNFGLVLYDPKSGHAQLYTELAAFKKYPHFSNVLSIKCRPSTGDIYFSTWLGLCVYNKQTGNIRVFSNATGAGFDDDYIYTCMEDRNGVLWVGTRSGIGIWNMEEKKYVPLSTQLAEGTAAVPSMCVLDMAEDKQGRIWLATSNSGIMCIRHTVAGNVIDRYAQDSDRLLADGALCLLADSEGRIWAGTQLGLMQYNDKTDKFDPVQSGDYPYLHVVNNMVEDRENHLWLTTDIGIVEMRYDSLSGVWTTHKYTQSDGLLDDFYNRNSSYMTPDGRVLFGGPNGLSIILPMRQTDKVEHANVIITEFRIFEKPLEDMDEKIRQKVSAKTISFTDKVTLTYDQNNFGLNFSLFNYTNSARNTFSYKLDGYDKDFVYANRHTVYYNNLKSGIYTFHVKGANANNVWSTAERTLQIEILPPLWRTWWAYACYLLLVLFTVYAVLRIVMNRVRMENELKISEINKRKAEELNQAKFQFFTNITHDLLTPLSVIMAAVDELKHATPDVKEYNIVMDNAVRLMRLIQQILEFRKAESGCLKLKVAEGNISEFLNSCVTAFVPLAKKKKITVGYDSEEPAIIGYFDSDKVDKILYNLLSNATKYNREKGSIHVAVNRSNDASSVIIAVSDTGVGIETEQLNHIFDRFYDGEYRSQHTFGTGIGLSLVKNLVDVHHGHIGVKSVKGEGTVFTITLPIGRDAYTDADLDATPPVNERVMPDKEEANAQGTAEVPLMEDAVKLLIVEDDEDLLYLLKKHFRNKYVVLTAKNAEEAIAVLEMEETVSLIVSDVMMPGMNGYELCSYVKNQFEYCHIPVILITAKQTTDDMISGYASGADGYVTKPLNMRLLETQIENLEKKQQRVNVDFRKQLVFKAKDFNYTSMDEQFIQNAIDCVNKHLDDSDFGLLVFVREMNTSRTTLTNKLKTLTGLNPTMFINDIRLNAACRILDEKGRIRISDLAYAVGFDNPKYFSTLFKKKFGKSPVEYLKKDEG